MKFKLIFSVCLFSMLSSASLFGQKLTIYNGVSLSHLRKNGAEILHSDRVAYAGTIGIEYLDEGNFYLSTQLGYLQAGGKETNMLLEGANKHVSEKFSYGHLNTTFRLKGHSGDLEGYIGLGPYVDLLLGDPSLNAPLYKEGFRKKRVTVGLQPEAGVRKGLTNRLDLGINASFLYGLTPSVNTSADKNFYSNTLLFSLSLSYGW